MEKRVFVGGMAILIIMTLCAFELVKYFQSSSLDNETLYPVSSIVYGEDTVTTSDIVTGKLFFAGVEPNMLDFESRQFPLTEAKKSLGNFATLIVNELINGPVKESGLKSTLPLHTRLISPVVVKSGVAVVDLSKDFLESGRSIDLQRLGVYSIVNSLTEIKDINKVKITIEGKALKESKTNIGLDAPITRNETIISKGAVSSFSDDVFYVEDEFLE